MYEIQAGATKSYMHYFCLQYFHRILQKKIKPMAWSLQKLFLKLKVWTEDPVIPDAILKWIGVNRRLPMIFLQKLINFREHRY